MDISVADLKAHLSEVLRRLEEGEGPVIVRRRGTPIAVMREWMPSDETEPAHWSDALCGVAADVDDFETILEGVVRSRAGAGVRRVELDD